MSFSYGISVKYKKSRKKEIGEKKCVIHLLKINKCEQKVYEKTCGHMCSAPQKWGVTKYLLQNFTEPIKTTFDFTFPLNKDKFINFNKKISQLEDITTKTYLLFRDIVNCTKHQISFTRLNNKVRLW